MSEATEIADVHDAPASSLLCIEGLKVEFATRVGWVTVVEDVCLKVAAGETLGIVGESGSGKTVTGLALMGLLPKRGCRVSARRMSLDDTDLLAASERARQDLRGRRMAMIFQEPMSSLNPAFTVGEQIAETLRRHRKLSRKAAWNLAVHYLDRVGIPNAQRRARNYPHEFSGGMCQRAMIALAICCEPELLVADEPTTALDVTVQAQILDLLRDMVHELELGLVFVTHDLGVVADICDRVAVMYAGQIVATDDIYSVYERPSHPYLEGLMAAMPQLGSDQQRLTVIPGEPVSPMAVPTGCRFHPRCPYALEPCTNTTLELREVSRSAMSRCLRYGELTLEGPAYREQALEEPLGISAQQPPNGDEPERGRT